MPKNYIRCLWTSSKLVEMSEIGARLHSVLHKIKQASSDRPQDQQFFQPRLVAVSKTKPVSDIIEAYEAGQKVFGENYVNEFLEKASNDKLLELCPDIRWHFIGRLQRNKVSKLAGVAALRVVETVESERLADALNGARQRTQLQPLAVMVQVNTSGEQNKGGVEPSGAADLVRHIQQRCPALLLTGLMTIGAYNHSVADGPNPDFQRLLQCREDVCSALGMDTSQLELSMGMSSDYEHAILVGSWNVRVGSEIFGARAAVLPPSGGGPTAAAAPPTPTAAAAPPTPTAAAAPPTPTAAAAPPTPTAAAAPPTPTAAAAPPTPTAAAAPPTPTAAAAPPTLTAAAAPPAAEQKADHRLLTG